MRRYGRAEFVAFGLLPLLNAAGLLIRGLYISTGGNYGEGKTIPALVVLVALILAGAVLAAMRRGLELGLPWYLTLLIWVVAVGPLLLVPLAFYALKRGPAEPKLGEPSLGMGAIRWTQAVLLLAAPWILLPVLARVLSL